MLFSRSYTSSAHALDVGLGHGWSHSLGWRVEVHRRGVRVHTGEGTTVEFASIAAVGDSATSRGGFRLRRETNGFSLDAKDDVLRVFSPADARGKIYRLSAVEDVYKNRIALQYDDIGRLAQITDSAGRTVRVTSTSTGRIESIAVKNAASQGRWIVFATYRYNDRGGLVAVTNADGHAWRYVYTDEHLLTSQTDPTGLTFHYVYDDRHRCIETWGDYPGRIDPALADGLPRFLADHTTKAKGILHCKFEHGEHGYVEVVDALKVQRLFGNPFGTIDKGITGGSVTTNTFDERGNLLARTDPMGATTRYEWDDRCRLLKTIDPLGRATTLVRDADGRVVQMSDPAGNTWTLERNAQGKIETLKSPRGAVWTYRYDDRGQLIEELFPNGSKEILRRDAHGNVIERVAPTGAVWRYEYDFIGRWVGQTNPLGDVARATFSNGGMPVALHDPAGGVTRMRFDGVGNMIEFVDPEGRGYSFAWGGNHWFCAFRYANGDVYRRKYDREGNLLEVHNERGEVHRMTVDPRGNVIEERTFDGRRLSFRYDGVGRRTRCINGAGEETDFTYNEAGELVRAELADETSESYEYDPRGALIAIRGSSFQIERTLDEVGNILRETQTVDGQPVVIQYEYDLMNICVRRSTSLGHTLEVMLDAAGHSVRSRLDGADEILHVRDQVHREIERRLPGGGTMHRRFDAVGQLTRQWAEAPRGRPPAGSDEPAWIGDPGTGVTTENAYSYSLSGDLVEHRRLHQGATRYEYDVRDRLVSAIPDRGLAERFLYDATSNHYEAEAGAPARAYAPGDRLVQRGEATYEWDADGRLVAKRVCRPSGEQVWRYAWNAQGYLHRVTAPDGMEVSFVYDAFGRRLTKKVFRPSAAGDRVLDASTRFVWDNNAIVHEIRSVALSRGDPIVEERTYCFEGDTIPIPWAHSDARRGAAGRAVGGPWYHYFCAPMGAPEALVGPDATVACAPERRAFGATNVPSGATTTPLRFAGQYEDEEVGLVYNRFRYYDPEAGRYISADPIGLRGGTNLFLYANNPVGWMDPWGLHRVSVDVMGTPRTTVRNPETGNNTWRNVPGSRSSPGRCDDSEQRALAHMNGEIAAGRLNVNNRVIQMHAVGSGGLPPCPQCHAAMDNFCRTNNCTILYTRTNPNDSRGRSAEVYLYTPQGPRTAT